MEGVWKVSGRRLEGVWMVSGWCLEGVNFLGPKFFGYQIFSEHPNFLRTQNFHDQNFLEPEIFSEPQPKIFKTNIFVQFKFFGVKICSGSKFFRDQNFQNPNFLGTQIFLGPKC